MVSSDLKAKGGGKSPTQPEVHLLLVHMYITEWKCFAAGSVKHYESKELLYSCVSTSKKQNTTAKPSQWS